MEGHCWALADASALLSAILVSNERQSWVSFQSLPTRSAAEGLLQTVQ